MKNQATLQLAIKILEIPDIIRVKLVKSKRAPVYSTLATYRLSQDGESTLEYIIEYRKSLSPDLLKHELCHLKLHLMGLPVIEVETDSRMSLTSQVLNTLHEDFYADLIMHQKFPDSFSSLAMKALGSGHPEDHGHDEVDASLLAWLLQKYVLKLTVFETLSYGSEVERITREMKHLSERFSPHLSGYLNTIANHLRRLPPLDTSLRQFTAEEKDSIIRIVKLTNNVKVCL